MQNKIYLQNNLKREIEEKNMNFKKIKRLVDLKFFSENEQFSCKNWLETFFEIKNHHNNDKLLLDITPNYLLLDSFAISKIKKKLKI